MTGMQNAAEITNAIQSNYMLAQQLMKEGRIDEATQVMQNSGAVIDSIKARQNADAQTAMQGWQSVDNAQTSSTPATTAQNVQNASPNIITQMQTSVSPYTVPGGDFITNQQSVYNSIYGQAMNFVNQLQTGWLGYTGQPATGTTNQTAPAQSWQPWQPFQTPAISFLPSWSGFTGQPAQPVSTYTSQYAPFQSTSAPATPTSSPFFAPTLATGSSSNSIFSFLPSATQPTANAGITTSLNMVSGFLGLSPGQMYTILGGITGI